VAVQRPLTLFLGVVIGLTVSVDLVLLVLRAGLAAGKVLELALLIAVPALIAAAITGRAGVRRLFSGLTRWRIGLGRWLMVLLAMPALTLAVGLVTGSFRPPTAGWGGEALRFALVFALILLTASLWEETAWGGFVQGQLMARRGLLVGSLLTAIPFALIHVPLAYESSGLDGTTWQDAVLTWAFVLGSAPFLRYVAGTILVDTGGSVLAVAVLHASFNASSALTVVPGGWQGSFGLVGLTAAVVLYRRARGRSLRHGDCPALILTAPADDRELQPAVR
jgi:membrane protease YdiL (CAAX protease family)